MTQTQPARVRLAELQQSIPKLPQLSPVFSSKNIRKFLTSLMQGGTLWVQTHATMQSEVVMSLRFIGVDPDSPNNGSPTVWLDEDDGSIVIQGWKIADEVTMSKITAVKPVPDHETVIRVPARMAAFLMEACGGGTTGIRPARRG